MSLKYPKFSEFVAQIQSVFKVQLPSVDPTIFGSWARGLMDGCAILAQSLTFIIRDLEKQLFPQTATGVFLELWGGYEGLARNPATGSIGYITLDDTAVAVTTAIPALTEFTGANGIIYKTDAIATISAISQTITSLTLSGTTVTAVLPSDHSLATGAEVTISGATEPEYNGAYTVSVTESDEFTYQITGTPASPATGTPIYSLNRASISVTAQTTGQDSNLDSGAQLTNATYGTAIVQYQGLTGGASLETDDEYRERILLSRSIISGVFTPDQVKLAALGISGNTRAFVKKPTVGAAGGAVDPEPGQASCFVLRDNDANIIPSATIIALTKQAIIDNGKMPANTAEADLYVQGPTLVETAYTFTALSPDTPTMRSAVEANLEAFYEDSVEFETDVQEASFLGVIQNTQDLETGAFLTSFTLSAPAADISVSDGEIAALGVITWSI